MECKSNVLIIGPTPPPSGGISTAVENILNSNIKDKYNLSHININRGSQKDTVRDMFIFLKTSIKLICILIKEKPKIIHIHASSYLSFWEKSFFALISKSFRKKVLFHIHGGGFKDFYEQSKFKTIIRLSFRLFDKVIVLSENWKVYISKNIVDDGDKIAIIPNCVSFNNTIINNTYKKNELTIIFVGRLEKNKGIYDLLEAIPFVVNKYNFAKFIFVGPCDKNNNFKINSFIQKNGIGKNVIIKGELSKNDVFDELINSSIFILPSHIEAFPISILEAMSVGLPIIATNVGDIPEIIEPNKNGFLINKADKDDIIEKIMCLIDNEKLRKEMSKNNLKEFNEKYTIETMSNKLDKLYDEVLCNECLESG